jgi:hypothetical protein
MFEISVVVMFPRRIQLNRRLNGDSEAGGHCHIGPSVSTRTGRTAQ